MTPTGSSILSPEDNAPLISPSAPSTGNGDRQLPVGGYDPAQAVKDLCECQHCVEPTVSLDGQCLLDTAFNDLFLDCLLN